MALINDLVHSYERAFILKVEYTPCNRTSLLRDCSNMSREMAGDEAVL
jgi:hypothetical protein